MRAAVIPDENSNIVNEGITREQTAGTSAARYHLRPVEFVPIPRFDHRDAGHLELMELSGEAHEVARRIEFDSQRNRERYMEALGDPAARVHDIAARVLADVF